jgi:transketolase
VIPNLDVIRPADPEEVAGAWAAAMQRTDGPTALILTRQGVPNLSDVPIAERRDGAALGGYVLRKEKDSLEAIIMASGSEVEHALEAAARLGDGVRVVSMPCLERFDRQEDEYRESVLPGFCQKRVAIEAGVTNLWWKYVGSAGHVIGIDRFGLSAPGNVVMQELGITADKVVEAVEKL